MQPYTYIYAGVPTRIYMQLQTNVWGHKHFLQAQSTPFLDSLVNSYLQIAIDCRVYVRIHAKNAATDSVISLVTT